MFSIQTTMDFVVYAYTSFAVFQLFVDCFAAFEKIEQLHVCVMRSIFYPRECRFVDVVSHYFTTIARLLVRRTTRTLHTASLVFVPAVIVGHDQIS